MAKEEAMDATLFIIRGIQSFWPFLKRKSSISSARLEGIILAGINAYLGDLAKNHIDLSTLFSDFLA